MLRIVATIIFLCIASLAMTQPVEAAKAWWYALTFGDTAYINSHSTPALSVTFNNGKSFNRSQLISQIAGFDPSARIRSQWSEINIQMATPQTAIATNRTVETVGVMQHVYKFITVLVSMDNKWMVAAAQSTRELRLAPAVPLSQVGKPEDFAGSYRMPNGNLMKVVSRDTALFLVEPSGAETGLEAVGPGLFEIPRILSAGIVRFAFGRDASGRVTNMMRIAHVITTMQRVE